MNPSPERGEHKMCDSPRRDVLSLRSVPAAVRPPNLQEENRQQMNDGGLMDRWGDWLV